jgi:hypothetical protein
MEEYTNRELGILLTDIKAHLVNFSNVNKTEHENIEKHVIKTNGRVKSLELWRSFMLGGMGVIIFVIPFVVYKIMK